MFSNSQSQSEKAGEGWLILLGKYTGIKLVKLHLQLTYEQLIISNTYTYNSWYVYLHPEPGETRPARERVDAALWACNELKLIYIQICKSSNCLGEDSMVEESEDEEEDVEEESVQQ